MPKHSAGLLMFRHNENKIEVLLVHPGGPFWAKKDLGAWSIPKGEYSADENALAAAKREFMEETGFEPHGEFLELIEIRQKGGKYVRAWAFEGNLNPKEVKSNTFTMEWPPGSGMERVFPEIDRADWFTLDTARNKILGGQLPLLDKLEIKLKEEK